jgi:hypothetical protein
VENFLPLVHGQNPTVPGIQIAHTS